MGLREPHGGACPDGRREPRAPRRGGLTPMAAGSARRGDLRTYALVTGAYWADTIADGASRILVLFYFYERGYSPFEVATLFLFYEVFGIVANLVGGWLAARLGLKATLTMGLAVQLCALLSLALAPEA